MCQFNPRVCPQWWGSGWRLYQTWPQIQAEVVGAEGPDRGRTWPPCPQSSSVRSGTAATPNCTRRATRQRNWSWWVGRRCLSPALSSWTATSAPGRATKSCSDDCWPPSSTGNWVFITTTEIQTQGRSKRQICEEIRVGGKTGQTGFFFIVNVWLCKSVLVKDMCRSVHCKVSNYCQRPESTRANERSFVVPLKSVSDLGALLQTAVEPVSAPRPMIPVVNLWTTESCTQSNVRKTRNKFSFLLYYYLGKCSCCHLIYLNV